MTAIRKVDQNNEIIPRSAWITVNRACNFRCSGCYAKNTGYGLKQSMSFELSKKIANLVSSLGISRITIIGGEPTLWNNLSNFNKFCIDKGLQTRIVTNAMRFGDDNFWLDYTKSPNTRAGVSIKAFDKKSLKDITGIDSFEFVKKGLQRAISHFKCGVSTVYSTTSASHILNITKFAMDCGAKSISISPCTPRFCNGKVDGAYVVEPVAMTKHLIKIYPKLVEITNGNIVFLMKLPLCLWPDDFVKNLIEENQINTICQLQHRSGIIFDVDGKLMLCNSLFDYPVGKYGVDFFNKKSLIALLNNRKTLDVYDRLTSYPSKKCMNCNRYDVCAGGCPLFLALFDPESLI